MRLAVLIGVLCLLPRVARPCTCAREGVVIHPNAREPAPLNTQIRVMWPKGAVALAPASLVLQTADKTPKVIATTQTTLSAADSMVVILVPGEPLSPKTRYQLMGASAPGGKPALLGSFTTSAETDTQAPTWKGAGKAWMELSDVRMCGTGKAAATILLPDSAALAKDGVLIGVWAVPPGKDVPAFDPAAPPVILAPLWGDGIRLGAPSMCLAPNFDLPDLGKPGDPPLEIKLRIAPIDLAGNVGTPADVVLRTGLPPKGSKGKPKLPAPPPK